MKILHIADLHFGKNMNEISLVEKDQPYWKDRFIEKVKETKADAVVIAGDVYDRSSPSAEAVALLDEMISDLSKMNVPVLMVAGNHDSGVKLGFASEILRKGNVYISGIIPSDTGEIPHVSLSDEYGEIVFWLMPYIFPSLVNEILGTEIKDYDTACRTLLSHQNIDWSVRNVMVAHQNVTRNGIEGERSGSESMVAGVGGIEYTAFEKFDYTALGHIHAAQKIGTDKIRYAGTPLCYHFDEAKYPEKGPVLVELKEKGSEPLISLIPVEPLHKVSVIKDSFKNIKEIFTTKEHKNEYLKAVVTDSRITPEISESLRSLAEANDNKLLEVISGLSLKNGITDMTHNQDTGDKTLSELFSDFYSLQRQSAEPDDKEMALISLIEERMDTDDTMALADRLIELAYSQEGEE